MKNQPSSICCVALVSTGIKDAVRWKDRTRYRGSICVMGLRQSWYTSTSEQNSAVIQFVIKLDIKFAKIHVCIQIFYFILDVQMLSKYLKRWINHDLWWWQTYWNLNGLHMEITDGWGGIGSGCQQVCCSSRHQPRPHPHRSGDTSDVLADAVQAQQAQSIQEVHVEDAQECQFRRPDGETGQCSAWEEFHGVPEGVCIDGGIGGPNKTQNTRQKTVKKFGPFPVLFLYFAVVTQKT